MTWTRELADMDPDTLNELFVRRPALRRFTKSQREAGQEVCPLLMAKYDGDLADGLHYGHGWPRR